MESACKSKIMLWKKEHFIEWIALVNDKDICKVKLLPGQNAECRSSM